MIHSTFGKGRFVNGGTPNDKVYTPRELAKILIEELPLYGVVLDPFKGGGAFYDNFPEFVDKEWCEIDDGKDFLEYDKKVDWIVSNPPYSTFDEMMSHSFEIADNVALLVPVSKIVSSMRRVRQINKYGGIKLMHIIPASKCGFPFGFPCCLVWMQKDYKGDTTIRTE